MTKKSFTNWQHAQETLIELGFKNTQLSSVERACGLSASLIKSFLFSNDQAVTCAKINNGSVEVRLTDLRGATRFRKNFSAEWLFHIKTEVGVVQITFTQDDEFDPAAAMRKIEVLASKLQ